MRKSMKLKWVMLVILSSLVTTTWANPEVYPPNAKDMRISLELSPSEKASFLKEMQVMLLSIQQINEALANENTEQLIQAAKRSGNAMARNTPDEIRQRLPEGFKALGAPTHLMFEELAIRAETDDTQELLKLTARLMQNCLACHAQYKAAN